MTKTQTIGGGGCSVISLIGVVLVAVLVVTSYRLQGVLFCLSPSSATNLDWLQAVAKDVTTIHDGNNSLAMTNVNGTSSGDAIQPSWEVLRERYGYLEATPRGGDRHPKCSRNAHGKWDFFSLDLKEHSRLKEDENIFHYFFKDFNGHGTYIELGAFDGKTESNTRFFDECLGWKGLLIEANPRKKDSLIANRPHADKIFFAPTCVNHNETVKFYAAPFTNAGQEGHALSYEGSVTEQVDVPCGPLAPVLENVFPQRRVNFFSLDVEGVEPLVLATIDFTKFQFDVVIIENYNNHCQQECESRDEFRKIMDEAGYLRFEVGIQVSDLYVHPAFGKRPSMHLAAKNEDVRKRQSNYVSALPTRTKTGTTSVVKTPALPQQKANSTATPIVSQH